MHLPIGSEPVLPVMVVNLDRRREIGVGAEVRRTDSLKPGEPVQIGIRGRPQPDELVIVHKEMNRMNLRFLTSLCKIKRNPVIHIHPVNRGQDRNAVLSRALKDNAGQIFIVPLLSVHLCLRKTEIQAPPVKDEPREPKVRIMGL